MILLVWALAASLASAQPRILGDISLSPYKLGELYADGVPPEAALIWDISDEDSVSTVERDGRLIWTARPGIYTVKLRSIQFVEGKAKVDTARVKITVEGKVDPGPNPDPNPGPNPGPVPPDPKPKPVGKLWILIVEETADAKADRGKWLSDRSLYDRIKSKGHGWRLVDKDCVDASGKTPKELQNWIARAKTLGMPTLFLIGSDGTVLYEGKRPATAAELLKLLDKVGG